MALPRETIAALATPVGTAAIAVLRVSGEESARLAQDIFGETPLPRMARHGDYRDGNGVVVDDVVFTFFRGPRSYTGEDALEISCHGNPFIAQRILEDLLARGCRAAMPGEFTQRAFLNGRMDLTQAESVMDLISARSERALAAANQQLRGSLGRRMHALTSALLDVVAQVEAYIDFPEEDLPPEDHAAIAKQVAEILAESERLLATSHYGQILRDGLKVVILGEPNAGKSSLLNRLVGKDRALVSPEAGTTRDFLEERIMLGSHGLRLIDTAGLNPSPGEIEKLGIEKTIEQAETADLILWVLDASRPVPALRPEVAVRVKKGPTILVWNKTDVIPYPPPESAMGPHPTVSTSALTGAGCELLQEAIEAVADKLLPEVGTELIAVGARHAEGLNRARVALRAAVEKLQSKVVNELLASDLREALASLGEVTGAIDNERVLDRLFASFCIGK